jgi:hypothetical protein
MISQPTNRLPRGPSRSTEDRMSIAGGGLNSGEPNAVTFGSVTVERTSPPSEAEVELNIRNGQEALARGLQKLIQPGIRIKARKGVPLFHVDPAHPDQFIRLLDGKRERGVVRDGEFQVIE